MGVGERLIPDVGRPIRGRVTGQEKSPEVEARSSGRSREELAHSARASSSHSRVCEDPGLRAGRAAGGV